MRPLGGLIAAAALAGLAGCATVRPEPAPACPAGQEAHRTAQLFFGRNIAGRPGVNEPEFRRFVDQVLAPKFPDGLTVLDGGGRWRGDENALIRQASKVVLIVLPKGREDLPRLDAVRDAYKARFHQDSVLLITPAACVSF